MMRIASLFAVLAACGGDSAPCAEGTVCNGACAVTFTGNFDETSRAAASCPHVVADPGSGDQLFVVGIYSPKLRAQLAISIDLGAAPRAGMYTPETSGAWHAAVAANAADSDCEYSAGSTAVPTGTFTLSLDAVAPLHGTLQILQFVQAAAGTPCGPGHTESPEHPF